MADFNEGNPPQPDTYFRSVGELSRALDAGGEFGPYSPEEMRSETGKTSRRGMLKLMAASMALAGLTAAGCRRWPKEVLAPFANAPRGRVPGIPEYYATGWELGGYGQGLLAASFDGRPIKVEGNPQHPMAVTYGGQWGATDVLSQATVLELYDPDRSAVVVDRTTPQPRQASWAEFEQELGVQLAGDGAGFAVLSEGTASPTMRRLREQFQQQYPAAGWFTYEPLTRGEQAEAVALLTGTRGRAFAHFDKAKVVVSFDDDFLGLHPATVRYQADWSERRRSVDAPGHEMSRVYLAETTMSRTGSCADVREPTRIDRIPALINALRNNSLGGLTPEEARFVRAAGEDLAAAGANGLVVVGSHLPAEVQAAALSINTRLGSVGTTIDFLDSAADEVPGVGQIVDLAARLADGRVNALVILGGNPAYDAPAELDFGGLLLRVPFAAHLSLYDDETSQVCRWHLPRAHWMEAWGDVRSYDGTAGVAQPQILPLYNGRSAIELSAMMLGLPIGVEESMALVQETAAALGVAGKEFKRALHVGVIPDTAYPTLQAGDFGDAPPIDAPEGGLTLRFVGHDSIYDGRFANNGWLQEAPQPLTKLTWDNALLLNIADAEALGIAADGYEPDESPTVRVTLADGAGLELPVYLMPGQPRGMAAIQVGFGRRASGNVGGNAALGIDPVGHDVYPIRTAAGFHYAPVAVSGPVGKYNLETTQVHHLMDAVGQYAYDKRIGEVGHPGKIVREATLAEFAADKYAPHKHQHGGVALQLWSPPNEFNTPHAWGMSIDMTACTGCNACLVACQSENNIPIVGKTGVHMNREMHWLRVDRYFKTRRDGAADPAMERPDVAWQPMMCVHCENAPCEQVCPVAATVHDTEGLNAMVYNRCIGTRYCSNNCPYKVRRFNYFDWHSKDPRGGLAAPYLGMPDQQQLEQVDATKRMVLNPDVTVRMRGVMEKCTYCTQRIQAVTMDKRNRWSKGEADTEIVEDFEIKTACQQACPTGAIVFGDLNQADMTVTKLQKNPRSFGVLSELNTRPRTKYLATIRNRPEENV